MTKNNSLKGVGCTQTIFDDITCEFHRGNGESPDVNRVLGKATKEETSRFWEKSA